MNRYSVITNKRPREIVLLKSKPCGWGKCSFCDYIDDNSVNIDEINALNENVLERITGEYNALEVINSGSVFELPKQTLSSIKDVINRYNIRDNYFETHYMYRHKLNEMREFFNRPIVFKCGIETFDHNFRNNILNKGVYFDNPQEVAEYMDSICLMVGIAGQTKDMIRQDIDILLKHFKLGCINVYVNNTTPIKADEQLAAWFRDEYASLESLPNIEVLWNNTDFGVGE